MPQASTSLAVSGPLHKKWKIWLCFISTIFALSGCGQVMTEYAVDEEMPADNSKSPGILVDCASMTEVECKMFFSINQLRQSQGLEPFEIHTKCVHAAQDHADDMVRRNYFSHDSPDEKFMDRMTRYSLGDALVAENIADNASLQSAIDLWMESPNHRANMFHPDLVAGGVGHNNGKWVQCFTAKSENRPSSPSIF